MEFKVLRASRSSDTNKLAGAMAKVIREHGSCEVEAIGAGAVNQAVKAVAVLRGYIVAQDIVPWCQISFFELRAGTEESCTGIRFYVESSRA
jgi:stage V sporulation protein S